MRNTVRTATAKRAEWRRSVQRTFPSLGRPSLRRNLDDGVLRAQRYDGTHSPFMQAALAFWHGERVGESQLAQPDA